MSAVLQTFPTTSLSTCRAFSLLEVVVALGVFTFAAISLLGLVTTALQSSHRAETQAACATIVRTEMAKLSSQTFTTNAASLPIIDYFTVNGTSTNGNTPDSSVVYRCGISDVSLATDPTNYMHQVSIVISWPNHAFTQTNQVVGSFLNYGH